MYFSSCDMIISSNPKTEERKTHHNISESEAIISMATVVCGITLEKNPPQSRLDQLGVANWSKWRTGDYNMPDIMRHTFKLKEMMYMIKGKVKITVEGYEDEAFEISSGDLILVPKGLTFEWNTIEFVEKAYLPIKEDDNIEAAATAAAT